MAGGRGGICRLGDEHLHFVQYLGESLARREGVVCEHLIERGLQSVARDLLEEYPTVGFLNDVAFLVLNFLLARVGDGVEVDTWNPFRWRRPYDEVHLDFEAEVVVAAHLPVERGLQLLDVVQRTSGFGGEGDVDGGARGASARDILEVGELAVCEHHKLVVLNHFRQVLLRVLPRRRLRSSDLDSARRLRVHVAHDE